jgi:hypothetical protein
VGRTAILLGVTLSAIVGWVAGSPMAVRGAAEQTPIPPAGATGAPGEGSCQACHGAVAGDGSLAFSGVPSAYSPGQTYTITVTLQDPGQSRWGFEATALRLDNNAPAGTLIDTSVHTALQTLSGRQYISHNSNFTVGQNDGTFAGTLNGPVSWTFDWSAPAAGAGSVGFYAAGNGANGNGLQTGDFIYFRTAASTEAPATAVHSTTWGKIKKLYLK